LPSKYTLAVVLTATPLIWVVLMGESVGKRWAKPRF
jgi:hypothetical protein